MAAKTDKKTLDLIKEVTRQKAEIASIERPTWQTNCSFPTAEGKMNDAINIHVERSVKTIISLAALLMEKEVSYDKAAAALGIENPPAFIWNGFSTKDWLADFKLRINQLQIATKKAKLEALENRLNAIISPELRAQMELEAIQKELG